MEFYSFYSFFDGVEYLDDENMKHIWRLAGHKDDWFQDITDIILTFS